MLNVLAFQRKGRAEYSVYWPFKGRAGQNLQFNGLSKEGQGRIFSLMAFQRKVRAESSV